MGIQEPMIFFSEEINSGTAEQEIQDSWTNPQTPFLIVSDRERLKGFLLTVFNVENGSM